MLRHGRRQLVSSLLVLSLLTGMVGYAFAQEDQSEEKNDPYIGMVSLTDEKEDSTTTNAKESDTNASAQNNDNKKDKQKDDKSKTDRYIIKYASTNGENKVDRKLKSAVKEEKEIQGKKDKKKKTELIILDEKVTPEEFATELRSMNIDDAIEYVQPDFELHPDSLGLDVVEAESGNKTDGDKTTKDNSSVEEAPTNTDKTTPSNEENSGQASKEDNTEKQPDTSTDKDTTEEKPEDGSQTEDKPAGEKPKEDQPTEEQPAEEQPKEEKPAEENSNPSPVIVAVIDTGADVSHESIRDFTWTNEDNINGWNFVEENGEIYNSEISLAYAHGTHISGIIAQVAKNKKIPLQLINCKVFENGTAYTSDVIEAIEFAEEKGAKIINMSFGGTHYNPALYDVMASTDAVFVTATGNNRMNLDETPIYPACFDLPNIISVSSTNADGGFSYFSNYSTSKVDITARGRDVVSALPENKSGKYSGTSMSTAYVSGVCAAVASLNEKFNSEQIKGRILDTADRFSNLQDKVENGRNINLENALSNTVVTEITNLNPEDDFDVSSYDPTPSEELELFSQKKAVDIAVGNQHTLLLMEDGTVWACGNGSDGQLGNGSTQIVNSTEPVQVIGLSDVIAIEAGYHFSLAIKRDGTLWAWGGNGGGALGIGSLENKNIPVQVPGLQGITSIATSINHSQAIDNQHVVYGWGSSCYGELGYHPMDPSLPMVVTTPRKMYENTQAIGVGAGNGFSAVLQTGDLLMRGKNNHGQLKDGTYKGSGTFSVNTGGLNLRKFACGTNHIIALQTGAGGYTWGSNSSGQLGVGSTSVDATLPQSFSVAGTPTEVAAGNEHSLILDGNGNIYGSGSNAKGQLLSCQNTNTFTKINSTSNIAKIDAAYDNSACIKNDGSVWIWGSNENKQIRNDTTVKFSEPVQIGSYSTSNPTDQDKISLHKNVSYDIAINAKSVSDFQSLTYTITYPVGDFEVITLCADASTPVKGIGKVPNTDVNIISVQDGEIQFKITKMPTTPFTGVVNTIKLRGLREGSSSVQINIG